MQQSNRGNQNVYSFDRPEFAHENQIGRIRRAFHRTKVRLADAVMHDAHDPFGIADVGAEDLLAISALKKKQVAAPHENVFEPQIEGSEQCVRPEEQAAAVGRVDAD